MILFEKIIAARGISKKTLAAFLLPIYPSTNDPFLLKDMNEAVIRLVSAFKNQDKITIYGDYDIDGLTATALLLDALGNFGFKNIGIFMPNRFTEGYGLSIDAIEKIAADGTKLIITVDCGSQSIKEIEKANKLGIDMIVTDHHSIGSIYPPAIAVINPKRADNNYPFIDLAGVGVAFKLVQALQTKLEGLENGREKWLLDLVALGTVCDIVSLTDENRSYTYWGLKVLSKTRRPGLKALMAVSGIEPSKVNARSLGYGLGPRMNAAGRLETAQHALDMLISDDPVAAFEKAQYLDELNSVRRVDQSKILKEAIIQADKYSDDMVLVVSGPDWNHGIVGIIASKLLEKYKKPVFVLQEIGDKSKGSARSYGDFNLADAIENVKSLISNGGGHKLAAGITLPTKNIDSFRKKINQFYKTQQLSEQEVLLLPKADAVTELSEVTEELVNMISQLEPFGNGNPQPTLKTDNLLVISIRKMGADNQHIKLELKDKNGQKMQFLAFNAPEYFTVKPGDHVSIWYQPDINEWQGRRSVEGRLIHIEHTF